MPIHNDEHCDCYVECDSCSNGTCAACCLLHADECDECDCTYPAECDCTCHYDGLSDDQLRHEERRQMGIA